MPLAVGLFQIYKKRWLARYWQHLGIKIIADLFVSEKFERYNFAGIPKGWGSYAIKQTEKNQADIIRIHELAKIQSNNDIKLFAIYGKKRISFDFPCIWIYDQWE
jgi:hypothetical protein